MDLQAILAYVAVLIAAFLAVRALVRAARGKASLPACPGCNEIDTCQKPERDKVKK